MASSNEKKVIRILYITAGIFLLVGIYMYKFEIIATKGPLSGVGPTGRLPDSFGGRGVIVVAFILAFYAAVLHYQSKKKQADK